MTRDGTCQLLIRPPANGARLTRVGIHHDLVLFTRNTRPAALSLIVQLLDNRENLGHSYSTLPYYFIIFNTAAIIAVQFLYLGLAFVTNVTKSLFWLNKLYTLYIGTRKDLETTQTYTCVFNLA